LRIAIFDFDRTILPYDSTRPLINFLPLNVLNKIYFYFISFFCKLNIISNSNYKLLLLKLLLNELPENTYYSYSLGFGHKLKSDLCSALTNKFSDYDQVHVISASFTSYIKIALDDFHVITNGTSEIVDGFRCLHGSEKYRCAYNLLKNIDNIEQVDAYGDSKSDLALLPVVDKFFLIKNCQVIKVIEGFRKSREN
jgi:hypothetical protein